VGDFYTEGEYLVYQYLQRKLGKPVLPNDSHFLDKALKSIKLFNNSETVVNSNDVTNITLDTAIVIHISDFNQFNKLIRFIEQFPSTFGLFFTVDIELERELIDLLSKSKITYKKLLVINHDDLSVPFIKILPCLSGYDLICNVTTDSNPFLMDEKYTDTGFNLLTDPILGSEMTVSKIIHVFQTHSELGMIGSADLFKSIQQIMSGYETQYSHLINILKTDVDPAEDWGFFAGGCFWARNEIFQPFVDNIKEVNFFLESGNAQAHAVEAVFGLLPLWCKKKIGLSYAIDFERNEHKVAIQSECINKLSLIAPKSNVFNEFYLAKQYQFLSTQTHFKRAYYLRNTPVCHKLKMDPLLHFLRYGVYNNQAPNGDFSPYAYLSTYDQVLASGENPFVHSLSHGFFEKKPNCFPDLRHIIKIKDIIYQSELFDR